MWLVLILIAVLTFLFYKWSTANYDYFEKKGIAFKKPFPLIGSNANLILKKMSMAEALTTSYYELRDEK